MLKCYFIILSLTLLSTTANAASSITQQQQHLKEITQQIKTLQLGINTDQQQSERLQKNLKQNQSNINQVKNQLIKSKQRLQLQQQHLQQLKQQQVQLMLQLQLQQQILAEQIRATYYISYQQHHLNAAHEKPVPYERLLSYFYCLHNARLQLIHQQQHTKETVDNRQQQTQQQAQQLRSLSLEQQRQQTILLQQYKQHEQALAKVSNQLSTHQQQLATLLANKQALEKLIQELQRVHVRFVQPKSPFADSRGKLNWPASGKIAKRFGSAIDQSGLTYAGILLAAPVGQSVSAIYPGRVIFANNLAGYGLLLIIDHGSGYMSLYGYNQSLQKKVGDVVQAGDAIAQVGDSNSTQGLYFEIRFNGHPLDPQLWCR